MSFPWISDLEQRHKARGEALRLLPGAVPEPAVPIRASAAVQGDERGTHLEPEARPGTGGGEGAGGRTQISLNLSNHLSTLT